MKFRTTYEIRGSNLMNDSNIFRYFNCKQDCIIIKELIIISDRINYNLLFAMIKILTK